MISKNLITKIRRRGRCTTRRKDSRVRVVELPRDFRRPRCCCCCCCCSFSFVAAVLHLLLLRLDCATKFGGVFGTGAKKQRGRIFLFCFLLKKRAFPLSSKAKRGRPSLERRKEIKLNMTARITYKRWYVLDALALYFLFIRQERKTLDATRARFGTSFVRAREGDMYICGRGNFKRVFLSLLF